MGATTCDANSIAGKGEMYRLVLIPHLPCSNEPEKKHAYRLMHPFLPLKREMDFKWVSCWWNKLLGDPRGWEFSIPGVEFGISKGAF